MTLRVLTVCTANVCRSPMAAALLSHHLQQQGLTAVVGSAGTQQVQLPVDPLAVQAVAGYGPDISAHRPRHMDRGILDGEGRDLVLVLTREHLRAVATTAAGSFRRSFTMREFVRRAAVTPPERGEGLDDWLTALGEGRTTRELMGDDPADDIADPYGADLAAHVECATELERLSATIARTLAVLSGNDA